MWRREARLYLSSCDDDGGDTAAILLSLSDRATVVTLHPRPRPPAPSSLLTVMLWKASRIVCRGTRVELEYVMD